MELLLVCEVREWEELFWDRFKAFLDKIGNDRVEEKERLTREWRANCWKRLNSQMHAALKRLADVDGMRNKILSLDIIGKQWTLSISLLFEGVDNPDMLSLLELREEIGDHEDEEIRLRRENEILDTEFRLKRGSDLGRFDQFWDDDRLFECRYSRSKWLNLSQGSCLPLEIYLHALKGNKNVIHITFFFMFPDFDFNQFLCDLPWVTSISSDQPVFISAVCRDLLFIKSINNDLNTFAKEIKLDPSSTYIFSDPQISDSGRIGCDARVLISFVPPTSGKILILRVKHSGEEDAPLEVTLGSTKIQLNPSSKSSLTSDDITLYPIEVSDLSESYHLSFEPEVRNDIVIRSIQPDRGPNEYLRHGHYLHDIELLDEAGLEYMPHSASLFNTV